MPPLQDMHWLLSLSSFAGSLKTEPVFVHTFVLCFDPSCIPSVQHRAQHKPGDVEFMNALSQIIRDLCWPWELEVGARRQLWPA